MRRVPRRWRRFFHVRPGVPYHRENSVRGLNRAVELGFTAIDLDACVTSDGVIVNTHWVRPMLRDGFRAPKGSGIRRWDRIDSLTWAQVSTLQTRDGYVIHSMGSMLAEAARRGLRVEVDAKGCPGLESVKLWLQLRKAAGIPHASRNPTTGRLTSPAAPGVQVKTISTLTGAGRRLRAAHMAGFTTIVLARGPVPEAWHPWIDYIRGRG